MVYSMLKAAAETRREVGVAKPPRSAWPAHDRLTTLEKRITRLKTTSRPHASELSVSFAVILVPISASLSSIGGAGVSEHNSPRQGFKQDMQGTPFSDMTGTYMSKDTSSL